MSNSRTITVSADHLATVLLERGLSAGDLLLAGQQLLNGHSTNGHAEAKPKPKPAPATPAEVVKRPPGRPRKPERDRAPKRPKTPAEDPADARVLRLQWCDAARRDGFTAEQMCRHAEQMHAAEVEHLDQVARLLTRARKLYKHFNPGTALSRLHPAFRDGDHSMISHFDEIAATCAAEFGILGGDPCQRLFELLAAGTPPRPTLSSYYPKALEDLRRMRGDAEFTLE